jgi:hypothetical protein
MHVNITWMTLTVHSIKNLLGELWEIIVYEVTIAFSLDVKSTKTGFRIERNIIQKTPNTITLLAHTTRQTWTKRKWSELPTDFSEYQSFVHPAVCIPT